MLPLLNQTPDIDNNMFNCISIKHEVSYTQHKADVLDYMVSYYPRNENMTTFSFVYGLFESKGVSFSKNQPLILNTAIALFSNSQPLGEFETEILKKTLSRLSKTSPTLPRRK